MVPDALVMRTIFELIDSQPKFNANYNKDRTTPADMISLDLMLLSSSLLSNQTFTFDTTDDPSAKDILEAWQDMCVAACKLTRENCSVTYVIFYLRCAMENDRQMDLSSLRENERTNSTTSSTNRSH